jgi:hypothetical protein
MFVRPVRLHTVIIIIKGGNFVSRFAALSKDVPVSSNSTPNCTVRIPVPDINNQLHGSSKNSSFVDTEPTSQNA